MRIQDKRELFLLTIADILGVGFCLGFGLDPPVCKSTEEGL